MIKKADTESYSKCCNMAKKDKFIKAFCATSYRWGWTDNLFVYEDLYGVRGFIQFNLCKRIRRSTLYYIYVIPEWRNQGIGKRLFEYYLNMSKKRLLSWKVDRRNVEALNFYAKLGYKPSGQDQKNHIFNIES